MHFEGDFLTASDPLIQNLRMSQLFDVGGELHWDHISLALHGIISITVSLHNQVLYHISLAGSSCECPQHLGSLNQAYGL